MNKRSARGGRATHGGGAAGGGHRREGGADFTTGYIQRGGTHCRGVTYVRAERKNKIETVYSLPTLDELRNT